ncbi:MAG TPA: O-antigen ligase family protein [Streptosporangiaceae bacterium]|nr:O-antigen ligase family protein [Streptosporangiaceae bacterium]
MNSTVAASPPRRGVPVLAPAKARERWARRRVAITWGLLVLNVLTFAPGASFIPIPSVVGKAITQGSLLVALLVALTVNRRVIVRPNVFLCLVSLLAIEAIMTSMQPEFLGSIYRTLRLAEFVAALWLLSPWWGRRDLLLVRCHLTAMSVVLGSVLVGLAVAPGHALAGGRLGGALWPIPATQVAHYAAVTTGLVVVLWLCGRIRGRATLLVVIVAGTILILTHTRTALIAMLTGILVAGLSLFAARARVRKSFAAAAVIVSIGAITLSSVVTTWLVRGDSGQLLTTLSGRTNVWQLIVNVPRNHFQVIFGFGLTNGVFNGLPIDSNWLVSYDDQGLFGVTVCATILLFLLVRAYFEPPGVQRALALLLVTYCLVASFTEVGFTDASTYMLDLTVAASLLVHSVGGSRPGPQPLPSGRPKRGIPGRRPGMRVVPKRARRSRHSRARGHAVRAVPRRDRWPWLRMRKGDRYQPFTVARPPAVG